MDSSKLVTWNVMIDIGFWSRLAKKKMEIYKLTSTPQNLIAKFRLSNKPEKFSILSIDAFSFQLAQEDQSGPVDFRVEGTFLNTNTIEQFRGIKSEQKQQQLIKRQIQKFQRYVDGENIKHLYEIFLLTFSDLKKHLYDYQFLSTSIPVVDYKVQWIPCKEEFQIEPNNRNLISNYLKQLSKNAVVPQFTVLKDYQPSTIKDFLEEEGGNYIFCLIDTTNLPKATGYHTQTALAFFAWLRQENKIKHPAKLSNIKILLVKEYLIHDYQGVYSMNSSEFLIVDASNIRIDSFQHRVKHKKGAQQIDLKSFMDEKTLAKEAVDLNIRLMKWRQLPTLNIEKILTTKCLLFGAGTLGCQLARNLIGWGVKNITFIDNSKVSYSNPVRQTLYEFEDTINGGKPKAETAAEKLRKIYPEINAHGFSISIPMPGHYVNTEEQVKQTFRNLALIEELVESHDVLFLLLDSREARWLPTVLANKYDKACITVGLGFDSYVIVRHGVPPQIHNEQKHGERLCCYFCNDIVTPQNTMKDRTLDQMCTVTKPGLSFISAAYAAQLYISLLHHPEGHHARASENQKELETTEIGMLPHHLRGNSSDFQTSIFYGKAFDQCVACSKFILEQYNNNREEFMYRVLNDPSFIHQVTGLKAELDSYQNMQGGIIEIIDDDFEFLKLGKAADSSVSTQK